MLILINSRIFNGNIGWGSKITCFSIMIAFNSLIKWTFRRSIFLKLLNVINPVTVLLLILRHICIHHGYSILIEIGCPLILLPLSNIISDISQSSWHINIAHSKFIYTEGILTLKFFKSFWFKSKTFLL